MKSAINYLIIIILSFNPGCDSVDGRSNYYFDSVNGNDRNSGNVPQQAFKSLAKIKNINISPGDTIFLRSGSVWFDEVVFPFSGSKGQPVVVTSYGSGNKPKLDGQLIKKNNLYIHKKEYIEVNNLHFVNTRGNGGVRIAYGKGIKIINCEFLVTGHGGIFIENSSNCEIIGNYITSPAGEYNAQTDGIYSQRNSYILIDRNRIILKNDHPEHHCDGIQSFLDRDITISGNYIFQDNSKTNSQGIYATNAQGKHIYINNIVYCPNTLANVIGFRNLDKGYGSLEAYNNTVMSRGSNNLKVSETSDVKVKNNIFISTSAAYVIHIENQVSDPLNSFNHNLYYRVGKGNIVNYPPAGGGKTFEQWQREGFDKNSIFADPKLDTDLFITSSSPAVDAGENISTLEYDITGKPRIRGKSIDIGAVEIK